MNPTIKSASGRRIRPISKKIYYSVEGKSEGDISPLWQILQVFFYAGCIFFGSCTSWLFTRIEKLTKRACVLHADMILTNEVFDFVYEKNVSCSIDVLQPMLRWTHCDFILSVVVVSITVAAFMMVMFLYCGRGGQGKPGMPDAWRIVWPAIVINVIHCLLVIHATSDYTRGVFHFKRNLRKQWGFNETLFDLEAIDCLVIDDLVVGADLTNVLYVLKETMYLWASFWVLNLCWILARCMFNVDFQLVRTTVYEYPKSPLVRRPVIHIPPEPEETPMKFRQKSVSFRPLQPSDIIEGRTNTK